jgi:hypothetical protein
VTCWPFGSAGAYGAVQSGTYNSRLLVPEVMVNGDQLPCLRPRPSYDDLIGLDDCPPGSIEPTVCQALTTPLIVALSGGNHASLFCQRPRLGRKDCYLSSCS